MRKQGARLSARRGEGPRAKPSLLTPGLERQPSGLGRVDVLCEAPPVCAAGLWQLEEMHQLNGTGCMMPPRDPCQRRTQGPKEDFLLLQ